jgi:phosphate transport system permease protein
MSKFRLFKEYIFQTTGLFSIFILFFILIYMLYSIFINSYKAFYTHKITLTITFTEKMLKNQNLKDPNFASNILKVTLNNLLKTENIKTDDILSLKSIIDLSNLLEKENTALINKTYNLTFLLNSAIDNYLKNNISPQTLTPQILQEIKKLRLTKIIYPIFNIYFFTKNDSFSSELAGIKSAFIGSISSILVALIFSFIIGVSTAIYLEEFSSKKLLHSIVEININNLASVPSIIYGLLGITILQNFLLLPRGSIILSGILLGIISLPTIIINTRLALRGIPNYIKESGYGVGASKHQIIFNLVLPLALPNILTGTVLAMLRALGETAPLLLLGAFIFNTKTPLSLFDKSTSLPIQILLWYNIPSHGFLEKASAAISILILLVIFISILTMYLKNKFEKKF